MDPHIISGNVSPTWYAQVITWDENEYMPHKTSDWSRCNFLISDGKFDHNVWHLTYLTNLYKTQAMLQYHVRPCLNTDSICSYLHTQGQMCEGREYEDAWWLPSLTDMSTHGGEEPRRRCRAHVIQTSTQLQNASLFLCLHTHTNVSLCSH